MQGNLLIAVLVEKMQNIIIACQIGKRNSEIRNKTVTRRQDYYSQANSI